jgi:ceramide glucosyltransferase
MSAGAVLGLAGLLACVGSGLLCYLALRKNLGSRRGGLDGAAPPVSILKPLAGTDEGLEANLESFYALEYPRMEIVFSFASVGDPAFPIARRVADRHPAIPSTFVIDAREPGSNSKVNRLSAAARRARHKLLLFSDGNVSVRPDFLRRAVSLLDDPRVGLVSHLFRGSGARSLASRLECLHLNAGLNAAVAAVAWVRGLPCVVGKSILLRRDVLDEIGGFGAISEYLAEDFVLGRAVSATGARVLLSSDVIDTSEVSKPLAAVWARHRRWALMRVRLGGAAYLLEAFFCPAVWLAALAASGAPEGALAAGGALLALRYGLEAASARRLGAPLRARDLALLPLRDLFAASVFVAGLLGRRVSWRGRTIALGRGTRILRGQVFSC